jgi:hypothetical protein
VIALLAIGVFCGAVIIDYADSSNTRAVAEGRAHAAARWSVGMYLTGLVGFYAVIEIAWWLCIFEAAGLYVGSWIAVARHRSSVGTKTIACTDHTARLSQGSYGTSL